MFGCEPSPFHALSVAIHLLNTGLLALFTRRLTGDVWITLAAVLLFCAQPGYVEAVVWVGAITDLLPATWFLLTLWLHLVWLQTRATWARLGSFVVFVTCLGTHESSVTVLPMMIALDALLAWPARADVTGWLRVRERRYAVFAVMLTLYLGLAYVVNSRSYIVRDGYYTVGWHMVENTFSYFAGMYIGRRRLLWHLGVALVLALLAWRGTPRVRFLIVWMFVTLAPVSLFTWGTASRYLYVPAAAFALLLADRILTGARRLLVSGVPQRVVATAGVLVVAVLVGRFAIFARGGVTDFRRLARPYEHFTAVVRAADQAAPGAVIRVTAQDVYGIGEPFVVPAAETALCRAGVQVVVDPPLIPPATAVLPSTP